jgi:putative hydroxymethylpyrimidine transport system permease protein
MPSLQKQSLSAPAFKPDMSLLWQVWKFVSKPQLVAIVGALFVWEASVWYFTLPIWYLPSPSHLAKTFFSNLPYILPNAGVTALETVLGFIAGVAVGMTLALIMASSRWWGEALAPLTVVSQAIPFLALAPLMMIWFGFGMTSKVMMAAIVIFFSVTAAFYDGLKRADENLVDLAKLYGANDRQILWNIRIPASMPQLATGLKLAAAYAPMGAIAGEWVGSEGGLGIMMTYHNARMQTDMVFAAMIVIIAFCLFTWLLMDLFTKYLLRHYPDTLARRA